MQSPVSVESLTGDSLSVHFSVNEDSRRRADPKPATISAKRAAFVKAVSFKLRDKWEEVDRGEHADSLVTALKKLKHTGTEMDKDIDFTDVEKVLEEQYPGTHVRPTPFDMDESLRHAPSNGLLFGTGQWVEYYGGDSQWHLGLIRRVFAKAPLDYRPTDGAEPKWEYTYSMGRGVTVPPYLVRAPEEALKRAFGMRPFVFLQWALLRVESLVVFKETHQRDFEVMNFQYAAEMMWEQFLNHPNNQDFKAHFDNHNEDTQRKLVEHLLSVFAGMDRLSKMNAPGSRWDFKTQNISIYTYPSLLGSGWMTCLIILALQVTIPGLLLLGALEQSPRFNGNEAFCRTSELSSLASMTNQRLEGLVMNVLVILLYGFRIFPHLLDVFYQTIGGEGWTPASRLNSLRTVVWNKGTDTVSMQLGFRLERLVKSVYMCVVCLVMLFVLFLSQSVLDIILNALAIEFIWQVDTEYAKSPFWDPRRRWIKAGAVECRLRATLDIHSMASPRAFCAAYNIPLQTYREAFGLADGHSLPHVCSLRTAQQDAMDEQYMSQTDVVWHWAGEIAKKRKLDNAIWQFTPETVNFGLWDSAKIFCTWRGDRSRGVFRRFVEYRTWSVWEQILFLSPVPSSSRSRLPMSLKSTSEDSGHFQGNVVDDDDVEAQHVRKQPDVVTSPRQTSGSKRNLEYLNFDATYHVRTPMQKFTYKVVETLRFATLYRSIRLAFVTRQYASVPFRLFDGVVEWLSYAIQVLFPVVLVGMAMLVVVCY